jgi:mRNA interferase RelE/StbE
MYRIVIKKSALKELEEIQKKFRLKIIQKIDELALDPRPAGVRKLESTENNYRVRVGDYRIIYQIVDAILVIDVIKIANRKEAYRNK